MNPFLSESKTIHLLNRSIKTIGPACFYFNYHDYAIDRLSSPFDLIWNFQAIAEIIRPMPWIAKPGNSSTTLLETGLHGAFRMAATSWD